MARSLPNPSPRAIDGPALPASRGPPEPPAGRAASADSGRARRRFGAGQVHLCTNKCIYVPTRVRIFSWSCGRPRQGAPAEPGAVSQGRRRSEPPNTTTNRPTTRPPLPSRSRHRARWVRATATLHSCFPMWLTCARACALECVRGGGGVCVCVRARVFCHSLLPRTLAPFLPRTLALFLAPSLHSSLPRLLPRSLASSIPPSLARSLPPSLARAGFAPPPLSAQED